MTRRTFTHGVALTLGLAACSLTARNASAQAFGNSNSPSTGPGSSAFAAGGSSPFGGGASNSPFGSSLNGGTFATQQGLGGNAANASAFNAMNPVGGTGPAGNLGLGQGGSFVGGRAANAQGIVGSNTNTRGQAGQAGNFGRNQFNQNQAGRGRNGGRGAARGQQDQYGQFQQGQGNPQQQARQIRPQLRVGFQFPKADTEVASDVLNTGFAGVIPNRPEFKGISVTASGTSVILRGTVDSPQSRKLAGRLAALEPGVRKVINEIEVAPAPAPVVEPE